jgi:hypothetical protein
MLASTAKGQPDHPRKFGLAIRFGKQQHAGVDVVSGSPELSNVICLQKPFRPHDLSPATEVAYEQFRPTVTAVS